MTFRCVRTRISNPLELISHFLVPYNIIENIDLDDALHCFEPPFLAKSSTPREYARRYQIMQMTGLYIVCSRKPLSRCNLREIRVYNVAYIYMRVCVCLSVNHTIILLCKLFYVLSKFSVFNYESIFVATTLLPHYFCIKLNVHHLYRFHYVFRRFIIIIYLLFSKLSAIVQRAQLCILLLHFIRNSIPTV